MVEPAWSWTLLQQMPSTLEAGHLLIEQLLAALTSHGWDGRDFFHVQMAAEEAMVNAVKHGNHEQQDKLVEIEFKVCREWSYLRFKDEGPGFRPDELPDPREEHRLQCTNGRGVMLIKEMMTKVEYSDLGNEVEMLKRRTPSTVGKDNAP